MDNRKVSADCIQIIAPSLKNVREMTQSIFEMNLTGDLAKMKAGTLQYALGMDYRENGFDYTPDNLSDIQNVVDPIAGLFPTEHSAGDFNVKEIYGELLVPIVANGPKFASHFNLELGGRVSDWNLDQVAQSLHLEGVARLGDRGPLPGPRRLQPRVPRAELGRALRQAHADFRRRRFARLVRGQAHQSRRVQRDAHGGRRPRADGAIEGDLHGVDGRWRSDGLRPPPLDEYVLLLLARIHHYTVRRLRAEIEPVAAKDFLRFLFAWQRGDGRDASGGAGCASSRDRLTGGF